MRCACRSKFVLAVAILALVLFLLLNAGPVRAQEEESAARLAFEEGRRKYEDFDFQGCIEEMTAIIEAAQSRLGESADAGEEELVVYTRALEYRAVAHFNLAATESAAEDFRSLIRFAPTYALSGELASPSILQYFEEVRAELVGFLAVTTQPSGAAVAVDGADAGVSGGEPVMLLGGSYAVGVTLRGYAAVEREVEVRAGETAELSLTMARTTATVFVRTSPPGAEVLLDGELVGVTSGIAGEDYAAAAEAAGIELDAISTELPVPYLEPGRHLLVVRKECFEPARVRLDVTVPTDLRLSEPVVLEPSEGTLVLAGVPADARVLLNGREQERGQAHFERLCSGEYRVEVLHDVGSFSAEAVVRQGGRTEVEVSLQPALVYLGEVFRDLEDEELRDGASRRLRSMFEGVSTLRIIGPGDAAVRDLLRGMGAGERLSDFAEPLARSGGDAEAWSGVARAARVFMRNLDAGLLAVSVFQERRLGLRFRVFIFGIQSDYPDVFVVDLDDPAQLERAGERLDHAFAFTQAWLGIRAVDTRIHEGTAVIAVQPGSPAAEAGIEAGAVITAVDGAPVAGFRQVIEAVEGKDPGETITLDLRYGSGGGVRTLTLGSSPVLLPLVSQRFCYNAAIAALSLQTAMNGGTELEQLGLLNIGLAHAHFGAWEDAIAYLRRVELGDGPGINQGTAEYFLGLCYESIGYSAEALNHYRRALEFEAATLGSNDGPLIGPRVRRKVQQLGAAH